MAGVERMDHYDICDLPVIRFAHAHSAENYTSFFRPDNSILEVLHVVEGTLYMFKEDRCFIAEKGDIVCIICDQVIHGYSEAFHCHRTVSACVKWVKTDASKGLCLPFVTKASAETEEIAEMIDTLVYHPSRYESAKARGAGDFLRILNKIDEISRREEVFHEPAESLLVNRAKKFILNNLSRKITQAEVAEYLNVTPQYLCRVFRKQENTTLMKYANKIKLQKIQEMMEKENLKLYEAAQLMGYSDAAYVSRLYKQNFGRSITSRPSPSNIIIDREYE